MLINISKICLVPSAFHKRYHNMGFCFLTLSLLESNLESINVVITFESVDEVIVSV